MCELNILEMSKDINKVYLTAERKADKNKGIKLKNLSLMLIQETPNSIQVSETHIPIGYLQIHSEGQE